MAEPRRVFFSLTTPTCTPTITWTPRNTKTPTTVPTSYPAATAIATRQPTPSRTPTPTRTTTPTWTPTGSPTPFLSPTPIPGLNQTIISYDYDLLYRLTAADYSNGDYYHYTLPETGESAYDAVGNRLRQEKSIGGLVTTDTYVYDDANRLSSVNGVNYTWDNNGNLLNDGVNTYTYNSANRLKTLTGPSTAASYAYNGMGDRLQEIVNGQTTTFAMDYNMGLTQVLNDGTNNYIYGNGRIAQVNIGTEYFLGDALGSVRQLTNSNGTVTYASAYDPYGVKTQTHGASQSAYGYTGEYTSNDLVYLRARYYAPYLNQFIQPDTIVSDLYQPMDWNKYLYVRDNPINYTDPSGHSPLADDGCPGCKWPKHNKWAEKAQKYGNKSDGYMTTYAIAAIGVQNPNFQRWYLPKSYGKNHPYTHLGIAKVCDKEMDTDEGVPIWDSDEHTMDHFRGYGLGMNGQDQTDKKIAVKAMIKRIQIITDACDEKCTSTDIFIIASQAQNGPGFNLENMKILMKGKTYTRTTGTHSLDWLQFIQSADSVKKNKDNQALLGQFASNVLYLESQGWDVPQDIDWKYVNDVYKLKITAATPTVQP